MLMFNGNFIICPTFKINVVLNVMSHVMKFFYCVLILMSFTIAITLVTVNIYIESKI